jgi:hypothetical protein
MSQAQAAVEAGGLDLNAILERGSIDVAAVGRALDQLDKVARRQAVDGLSARAQAQLYEAAKGARRLTLQDLVPPGVPELTEVVHHGKNSLVMFTSFAKVFCRPKADSPDLWGYNRTSTLVQTAAGPGYFVAYEGPGDELLIDYTRLPEGKLESWPAIRANQVGLGRFVYGGLIDALRAVSAHVTVGRAIRGGKVLDNWFVLCREE